MKLSFTPQIWMGTLLIAFFCLYWLFLAFRAVDATKANRFLIVGLAYIVLQCVLAATGFFYNFPLKPIGLFLGGILPALLCLIYAFKKHKAMLLQLSSAHLTRLHTIRVPVEIGLYVLFLANTLPVEMTFEGRNFDIVAGITAPFVAYFGIQKGMMSSTLQLIWNVVCLLLLANIVITAALSIVSPFQVFGHAQPNWAALNVPVILLPTFIVPSVLFAHLVCVMQLRQNQQG